MATVLSALFALLAALGNATGTVLQRTGARSVPPGDAFSTRLIRHLLHHPAWLGGIAVIVVAAACQALALTYGPLSLVQPILVTELPLTLLIACMLSRRRLPPAGWTASVTVAGGLALTLVAAAPTGSNLEVPAGTWVLTLLATAVVTSLCVLAALRQPRGKARAALFSSASAIGYALTATLMKSATHTFDQHGAVAFLTSWQTYAFLATGAYALFLLANAMESGPLIASQPALTLGEGLVSVAFGILVYGEHIRTGTWLIPELIGAALITWGTLTLAKLDTDTDTGPGTTPPP
ncbi:DMT family transporter [Streptomyces sp. NPDC048612]|uniref:DMT family transporter n=1 Tax=Streptomyces sp. NPDC048612 TaxID=3365579 RepID=UPI0037214CDF